MEEQKWSVPSSAVLRANQLELGMLIAKSIDTQGSSLAQALFWGRKQAKQWPSPQDGPGAPRRVEAEMIVEDFFGLETEGVRVITKPSI
jgi:hypothetical protein